MANDDYKAAPIPTQPRTIYREPKYRQPGDIKLGKAKQSAFTSDIRGIAERFFAVPDFTSYSSAEARRLAKWLLRVADWMDDKRRRGFK